ncbi:MAG: cobalamin-binding protein [Planctomycetaceae bacterium]|nr:cobalamin-binding protein [Planctomycetaceae bacterium]
MKLRYIIFIIVLVCFAAAFFAVLTNNAKSIPQSNSCNRIVSLAPNITEILFALGLGDKIVGTSEFCNYPPAAKQIQRVGALMNPNFEAIVALKPDLVIMVDEMADYKTRFDSLGIETLIVKHDTINEILDSINIIGQRCGKTVRANEIVSNIKNKILLIQNAVRNQSPPRVMISLGHDYSQDPCSKPQHITIAGNDGFYSQMIEYAGGKNIYDGKVPFPVISWESVIAMNPQIIIDIGPVETKPIDAEITKRQWKNFSQIDAAKNNAVYVFTEDYTAIPGPRFILTLEKIAHIINPNEPNSN